MVVYLSGQRLVLLLQILHHLQTVADIRILSNRFSVLYPQILVLHVPQELVNSLSSVQVTSPLLDGGLQGVDPLLHGHFPLLNNLYLHRVLQLYCLALQLVQLLLLDDYVTLQLLQNHNLTLPHQNPT